MRDHAYRRAVRRRWINRRMFIVNNIWIDSSLSNTIIAGTLSKYNFAHGTCRVCQSPRDRDTRAVQRSKADWQ